MKGYLRPSLTRFADHTQSDARELFGPTKRGYRKGLNGNATNGRLTHDQVRWVRANAVKNGGTLSYAELGAEVGLKISGIKAILCGNVWKEIT